ncbi:dihydroorotate dehydrogenase-like protein [Tenuifilum thalassicum]|uniref:Dihydroorotate dehydrogenase-like protein n=1 Tax=Tenuifilum thalassicum TaxID=2590900 RepID=A0A7D4AX26_9BACT|nr:dihydroorotate dehydrogenase-like protein [Tenuifilum thalassicum]QKG79854.1 dihydroorotate dehydrogenase-like protein [Tenuifilum thalassicum]
MSDLSTNYMGLNLRNPLIISSSGLTEKIDDIKEFEARGAGAVVIKSIFEEEIIAKTQKNINQMNASGFIYPETMEYFDYDSMEDPVSDYLQFLRKVKEETSIPIIASINCVTAEGWIDFAKRIEDTGIDALELNVFPLPSDPNRTAEQNDKVYFDIAEKVTSVVKIPVAMKVGYYHSALSNFLVKLSKTPIKGLVLFNRFYNPDFDINTLEFKPNSVFSSPNEISTSLRWVAILSGKLESDIAASTGVHDGIGMVKQLLAGANAVQACSTFYRNGNEQVTFMLKQLDEWMKENGYNTINDFRGKMSIDETYNPSAYERVQFMKYFHDL